MLCSDVNVSYKFFGSTHRTLPSSPRTTNPKFNDVFELSLPITEEFVDYIRKEALEFQIWGAADQVRKLHANIQSQDSKNKYIKKNGENEEPQQEKQYETDAGKSPQDALDDFRHKFEMAKEEFNQLKEDSKEKITKLKKESQERIAKLKDDSQANERALKVQLKLLQDQLTSKAANVETLESKVQALQSTLALKEKIQSTMCVLS